MAYPIDADWDGAAEVWIATIIDVQGLCAEAASLEALTVVVVELAPELPGVNDVVRVDLSDYVPIRVLLS